MPTDYFTLLTGPDFAAATQRPAPISESSKAAGLGATVAGSYVDDPMVRARMFAERRGIPLSRYRVVRGRPVYRADDGKEYFEEPDFAPMSDPGSALTGAASLAGPATAAAPPLAAGIVTAPMAITGPGGLAASMGLTGLAGAGGQYLKEAIGNAATGETQRGTGGRAFMAGGANALGQGVGAGINAAIGRFVPRDIARMDPRASDMLQRKSLQEGIPLTPAETTNLESLKSTQRMLTNMPASSGIMRDFYEGRAENIAGRVQGLLDSVGKQDSAELAAKNLKEWAITGLQAAKNERASAAGPFYERAKASGIQVDPRPVLGYLDRELQTAKGAARAALLKARSYFFQPETQRVDTSIRGLHSAKLALDDLLGGLEPDVTVVGPGGTKSTSFRAITEAQQGLTKLLGDASPDYAEGLATFQRMSGPLNNMQNSLIGVLARTDDANAQKSLLNMFNPATSGPRAAFNARAIFDRMGPEGREAWQDAKRIFLQDAWAKASKEFKSSAQSPNTSAGAGFRALLLGDQRQAAILKTALTKPEFDALSDFGDVVQATNRVRLSGSETAWNAETLAGAKERARPLVMRIIRNLNPAQALRSFDETVTNHFFQNDMEKMARIYTSPDAMKRLRELRVQKPGSQRFVTGVVQLAAELGEDFVGDMLAISSDTVGPAPGQAPIPGAGPQQPQASTRRQSYSEQLGLLP